MSRPAPGRGIGVIGLAPSRGMVMGDSLSEKEAPEKQSTVGGDEACQASRRRQRRIKTNTNKNNSKGTKPSVLKCREGVRGFMI